MPWKTESVMEQRIEFLVRAKQPEVALAPLCREYGISRQTAYTWLHRLETCGSFARLQEHSRRPAHSPRRTPAELEARVLALRAQYQWGARKLQVLLAREDIHLEEWTIHRILRRHGLVAVPERHGQARRRFARAAPNELHQLDFKGEYPVAEGKCYPLSLLDDHSRYLVGLWPLPNTQLEGVQEALRGLFREQGVPEAMLMDHGSPWWSTTNGHGLTRLSVWLMDQEIELLYGRPYHPQTQGKVERFHRTLKERTAQLGRPPDLAGWGEWAQRFRTEYNEVRPHEAIGRRCPAEVYSSVHLRPYQEAPPPPDYPRGVVRRLNPRGCLDWRGRRWFVCEALAGRQVCLEEVEHLVVVSYRRTALRELDQKEGRTRAFVRSSSRSNVSRMSC